MPQVPRNKTFEIFVYDPRHGKMLLDLLAHYDLWLLHHKFKPDYSNAGGLSRLQIVDDKEDWYDWDDEDNNTIDEVEFDLPPIPESLREELYPQDELS